MSRTARGLSAVSKVLGRESDAASQLSRLFSKGSEAQASTSGSDDPKHKRIEEAEQTALLSLARKHPKNTKIQEATLEIQNAYSGNTHLNSPDPVLRKWHSFYCSQTANIIFYINMAVDVGVQIYSMDYPIHQTKDWDGLSPEEGVCPCYIYQTSSTTNADQLAKFHMMPPGYKSLIEPNSTADTFVACLTDVTGEVPMYDMAYMDSWGLLSSWLTKGVPRWTGVVTMLCAIVALLDRYIKYRINGKTRFLKTKWNPVSVVILALMFIQGMITAISGIIVNYITVLHPWLIIAKSSALKTNIKNTILAFKELKPLAMLTGIFLVAFALVATQMERAVCSFERVLELRTAQAAVEENCKLTHTCDYRNTTENEGAIDLRNCDLFQEDYPNFISSVITLFVMLTTENYPDVSYGPTKIAEWVIIFYIFYIFFVLFVIMSIILAVNYEAFKDLKITNRNKKKQQDYDSLMKAYLTLTNDVMDYDTYIALMACLHEHQGGASRANLEAWDRYFHDLDEDAGGTIDAVEFSKLLEVMKGKMTESKNPLDDWVKRNKRWGGLPFFRRMVDWKHFGKIADMAIVLNCVTLMLSNTFNEMEQYVYEGRTGDSAYFVLKVCEYLDDVFCLVFVVEIMVRVFAYGIFFIPSMSNWFDLIVSLAGVPGFSCFGRCKLLPVKVNVLRLMRTPRLLRLLGSSGEVSVLIRTAISIVPPVSSMIAVLVIIFASLGFLFTILFRCSYRYLFGEASDILLAANFNTIIKSLTIVFQVLTGSNWHEVMHSAQWSLDPEGGVVSYLIAILFMIVFTFLVLCVMNLVVSLVIESYTQETTDQPDGDDDQHAEDTSADDSQINHQDSQASNQANKQPKRKRRLTEAMVASQQGINMKELEYSMMAKAAAKDPRAEKIQEQIQSHRSSVGDGRTAQIIQKASNKIKVAVKMNKLANMGVSLGNMNKDGSSAEIVREEMSTDAPDNKTNPSNSIVLASAKDASSRPSRTSVGKSSEFGAC